MSSNTPTEFAAAFSRGDTPTQAGLEALATGLRSADPELARAAASFWTAACDARWRRLLGTLDSPSPASLENLVDLLLLEPQRFASEAEFRRMLVPHLAAALPRDASPPWRDRLLWQLARRPGFDFDALEIVAVGWGAAHRSTAELRQAIAPAAASYPDDLRSPIRASIYSLPAAFFEADESLAMLAAVRRGHPQRPLVVLSDGPLLARLAGEGRDLDLSLVDTWGRPFSPWPRDPFSLVRDSGGGSLVLARPNVQRGREEDAYLGRALLQGLPEELFRAWGRPRWAVAPVPFHNGQVLLESASAWVSIHSIEDRILALLGARQVPVTSFETAAGIDTYLAAASRARVELEALYGRPVRFVHPLPESGEIDTRSRTMSLLGGGAGFDLDAYLTLLPGPGGGTTALVGDVDAGLDLLARLPATDLAALQRFFDLAPGGETLRASLASAQRAGRPRALDAYLDLVADHLARQGLAVARLPLSLVSTALLADRAGVDHPDFLLGWNNVVVEAGANGARAEGFASSLAAGDDQARRVFAAAGCRLELVPALRRSVVLNGGYRCASNHLR